MISRTITSNRWITLSPFLLYFLWPKSFFSFDILVISWGLLYISSFQDPISTKLRDSKFFLSIYLTFPLLIGCFLVANISISEEIYFIKEIIKLYFPVMAIFFLTKRSLDSLSYTMPIKISATIIIVINLVIVVGQFFYGGYFNVFDLHHGATEGVTFRASGLMGNPNLSAFTIVILATLLSGIVRLSWPTIISIWALSILSIILVQSRSGLIVALVSVFLLASFFGRMLILGFLVSASIIFHRFGEFFPYLTDGIKQMNQIQELSSARQRLEIIEYILERTDGIAFRNILEFGELSFIDNQFLNSYAHFGVFGLIWVTGLYLWFVRAAYLCSDRYVRKASISILICVLAISAQAEVISSLPHLLVLTFAFIPICEQNKFRGAV